METGGIRKWMPDVRSLAITFVIGLAAAELVGQPQPSPVPSPSSPLGSARLSPDDTLSNYARLTGRTILRPSNLAWRSEVSPQLPDDTNAAIALIEHEFDRTHIEAVRDGDKFVRILPVGAQGTQLANIKLGHSHSAELMPAGTIYLLGVDLDQVLGLYAELRDRTILRSPALSSAPIMLRTQNALTKDEVIYALETILALNGVAVVDDGVKFVQVVYLPQVSQVQTRARKPELNATLIDPRKVPVFKRAASIHGVRPPPSAPSFTEWLASGYAASHTILFGPPPPAPKPTVDNLIAYYAKLVDRTFIASKFGGQNPIFFEIRTPLTKAELVYAIEATLALDGLKIVPADNKAIRIEHIAAGGKKTY